MERRTDISLFVIPADWKEEPFSKKIISNKLTKLSSEKK